MIGAGRRYLVNRSRGMDAEDGGGDEKEGREEKRREERRSIDG